MATAKNEIAHTAKSKDDGDVAFAEHVARAVAICEDKHAAAADSVAHLDATSRRLVQYFGSPTSKPEEILAEIFSFKTRYLAAVKEHTQECEKALSASSTRFENSMRARMKQRRAGIDADCDTLG